MIHYTYTGSFIHTGLVQVSKNVNFDDVIIIRSE